MYAYRRERLLQQLDGLAPVVNRYLAADFAFPAVAIAWLDAAEKEMARLRLPQGARLSALRATIVAAGDALEGDGHKEKPRASAVRKAKNAAAAVALEGAEEILRSQVLESDRYLEGFERKLEETITRAVVAEILPPAQPQDYAAWLRKVWFAIAEHEATRPMCTYIATALGASDRLYVLDSVLSRLMGRVLPVLDLEQDLDIAQRRIDPQPQVSDASLLHFLREASPLDLRAAGVHWRLVNRIVDLRPLESLSPLDLTDATLSAVRAAAGDWSPGAVLRGVQLRSQEVEMLLRLLNDSSFDRLHEVVCLPRDVARDIELLRPFATLQTACEVARLGCNILQRMLAYLNDWQPYRDLEGVPLSAAERCEILALANRLGELGTAARQRAEIIIGDEIVSALIEAGPFEKAEDLLSVPGISRRTFFDLIAQSRLA
ncbi:MAG: hypothetical protein V3V08_17845 [Nannocystaceae bacterium]